VPRSSPKSLISRRATALLAAAFIAQAAVRPAIAATPLPWQADVGYGRLVSAAAANVPVGAGIVVSMVEAGEGSQSNYMPVVNSPEFLADPNVPGVAVTFTPGHSGAANTSNHANGMAHWFVGNTSGLSKATSNVAMYEANRWLNEIVNFGGSQAPTAQPFAVQNHSWVYELPDFSNNQSALRRFDYLIETGNMTAIVGANNNNDSDNNPNNGLDLIPIPSQGHLPIFASSYNAIVVGSRIGTHSRGATTFAYGSGRYKPDLVAPGYNNAGTGVFTSIATARTSSAAGVIRGILLGTPGDNSETAKAILMAGATKTEFLPGVVGSVDGPANALGFVEPSTGLVNNWHRTPTQPLDDIFGAGELNIMNSYLMTVGGHNAGSTAAPATAVDNYGWDYQDRKLDSAVGDIYYNFVVPQGSTAPELSVILAWNATITDAPGGAFTPVESLHNLDLALYDSTTSFLGALVDQSESTVDNVEHIRQTNLGPGTYTLKVSGAAGWDYGLAWRMATQFDQANADFDGDLAVTGADFLIWQRNLGTLVGAQHIQGDANGDGAVDSADLTLLNAGVMPQPMAQFAIAAVPEPAALALAAIAAGFTALAGRQRLQRRRG
jgi:hypothetical protein